MLVNCYGNLRSLIICRLVDSCDGFSKYNPICLHIARSYLILFLFSVSFFVCLFIYLLYNIKCFIHQRVCAELKFTLDVSSIFFHICYTSEQTTSVLSGI